MSTTPMPRIPANTLVMVADGTGARLFRNAGTDSRLSLHQDGMLEPKDLDEEGPSGVMPPESDTRIDEATFAKQLAQRLNEGALRQEYEHVVLVADPRTLGLMRPLLHKEVDQRMVAELAKTLTGSPLADIERALSAP
ncbi:host attachment family protein [Lysobacter sp. A3-1-A15]|uniref:host attachment family protein n=1 Tax=Novilysobacter viscosus TaxID=3098602 RepID=UPI002EDADC71